MRTYRTAYQAASAHATRHDNRDEFEENMLEYIDDLARSGVIEEVPSNVYASPDWVLKDGTNWYIFTRGGTVEEGPFGKKREAMLKVPDGSAKYRETGVYYLPKHGGFVARRTAFDQWEG